MVKVLLALLAALAVLMLTLVMALGLRGYTPSITDERGEPLPGSIAILEAVELGGMRQWITIRGRDRGAPVLLWLHGGPGGSQMPLAHRYNRELERHLVVVQWDQRGAGKSNPLSFDSSTMRLEQYLEDAGQLIDYLRVRLDVEQIVLLGHSWGTQLGLHLVHRYPHHVCAYIGVGQVVHHERATDVAADWLSSVIDNDRDRRALEAIRLPAKRHADYRALNTLVSSYGGSSDLSFSALARVALRAPEYSALDYWHLYRGMQRGGGPLHQDGVMAGYDMMREFPVLTVPVYWLMGEQDYNTPASLVREYLAVLSAPHAELVTFEHSAHLPFVAEPEKFTHEILRIVFGLQGDNTALTCGGRSRQQASAEF